MARCGVPGIDLPIERPDKFACGCNKVWYGRPVDGYVRHWTSDCTDPEHEPKHEKAS